MRGWAGMKWEWGAGDYGERLGACVGWEVDVWYASVVEEIWLAVCVDEDSREVGQLRFVS